MLTGEYDAAGLLRVRDGDRVVWDRALHGIEPDPPSTEAALETWAAAVAAAAERAVAGDTGVAAVKVMAPLSRHETPRVFVVDRAYLEKAERRVGRSEAIWRHWEDGRSLEVDDEGLRARRTLLQDDDLYAPHFAAILQRHVDERTWPDGAVALGNPEAQAPATVPAAPTLEAAPRDEAELAALIARFDLPAGLIETARWGLALVEGEGRSRVGGPPELPGEWPQHEGRPLTHVMTIWLDELPDVPGREHLPPDGTLVFLAALDEEDELVEPVAGDDPRVLLNRFEPGTALQRLAGDPEWTLEERRVRFEPVLTLPDRRDDLPPDQQLGYEQLYEALCAVTPGLGQPGHLVLGHPNFAHWDTREPGDITLLHFGYDYDLSIDGRAFTVHGPPDDVRAGRWERLTVTPQLF
ncbi:DUF1963 domain-containing protein [Solirubrobacter sp. CPCC 204708]|uniref:YwqG family protein n=1 Tax=Solirubrobacter deserti TaxID=2282478 RepID=A0ABT4RBZ1_9ACTN|nr:DUF1963 domain-containing protein [Solirubrobacter deserti]MBE2317054.1 DUF1963 domain-containing protein [Solirubrobacter deserti]MDA0136054.1 YwqG family protein [Solirubrobacter deserti]